MLKLTVLALALCVVLAAADKPHLMHKLVATSQFVDPRNGNDDGSTYYIDSGTAHGRADDDFYVNVLSDGKVYLFEKDENKCTYYHEAGDPADLLDYGTFPGLLLLPRRLQAAS